MTLSGELDLVRTAYKCRAYPTPDQAAALNRAFGCVRVVWNQTPAWQHRRRRTLSTRHWTCLDCGTRHDGDVNAAKNVLAAGRAVTASGREVRYPHNREHSPVKQEPQPAKVGLSRRWPWGRSQETTPRPWRAVDRESGLPSGGGPDA